MKTKVYAVAEKVPEWDRDGIRAGVAYPIAEDLGSGFYFPAGHKFSNGAWDDPAYSWTRLVLPDIDPRDVAELIEAARGALGRVTDWECPESDRLSAILNKIDEAS